MMLGIGIEQSPDHALILRVVFSGLILEEFDTPLAQRNRDLDPFVPKDKLFRAGKNITNDPEVSERFVRVPDFPVHISASPSASTQPQKSESRHGET